MITVRPMQKKDIDRVYEIEHLSFRTPWSKLSLLGELHNSVAHYYVLQEDAGPVAAYGGMWILFDEAHVTNVAVHPDFRGTGKGRQLFLAMMAQAARHGAAQMTLEVRETNTVAQNLYFSLGYEKQGFRKKYYTDTGEGALLLWNTDIQKTLNENACLLAQIHLQ